MSIGGWRAEGTAKHLAMEVLRASVACFVMEYLSVGIRQSWSIDLGSLRGYVLVRVECYWWCFDIVR